MAKPWSNLKGLPYLEENVLLFVPNALKYLRVTIQSTCIYIRVLGICTTQKKSTSGKSSVSTVCVNTWSKYTKKLMTTKTQEIDL